MATFRPSPGLALRTVRASSDLPQRGEIRSSKQSSTVLRHAAGFLGACQLAYNEHHHLVLDPNAVWLAILAQFAVYVETNAERLRSRFVAHETGKVRLLAAQGAHLQTADFDKLSADLAAAMEEHLQSAAKDWAMPNFSTTTNTDRTVACLMLMGAAQHYFDYEVHLLCGLPQVTLAGTVADWRSVRDRAHNLLQFDLLDKRMSTWCGLLCPVLQQFVASAEGHADFEWWLQMCNQQGGGSGPRYLSGWITVFSVFDKYKRWRAEPGSGGDKWPKLDTNDLSTSLVSCPVRINDNGQELAMRFEASVGCFDIGVHGQMIKPQACWHLFHQDEKLVEKPKDHYVDIDPALPLETTREACESEDESPWFKARVQELPQQPLEQLLQRPLGRPSQRLPEQLPPRLQRSPPKTEAKAPKVYARGKETINPMFAEGDFDGSSLFPTTKPKPTPQPPQQPTQLRQPRNPTMH
jgi:hypothetical protein